MVIKMDFDAELQKIIDAEMAKKPMHMQILLKNDKKFNKKFEDGLRAELTEKKELEKEKKKEKLKRKKEKKKSSWFLAPGPIMTDDEKDSLDSIDEGKGIDFKLPPKKPMRLDQMTPADIRREIEMNDCFKEEDQTDQVEDEDDDDYDDEEDESGEDE